jgi:hypothetical protein
MMALNASKFPPKSTTDYLSDGVLQPVPYEAVPGDPAVGLFHGETTDQLGGVEKPQPITVHVDGKNIVDILATAVTFRNSDGTPLVGKRVVITVTPDGTDIQDITVEDI